MRAERIIMSARSFPLATERTRVLKPFRSLLIEDEQVLCGQAQQSAACNASHTVEARMCRWLFHMRDFAGSDDLTLTQGISRSDAGCASAERVARGQHAAEKRA